MNFMMSSHVRGTKYKVCEIKVSICVRVYNAASKILRKEKKEINKIGRSIYPV